MKKGTLAAIRSPRLGSDGARSEWGTRGWREAKQQSIIGNRLIEVIKNRAIRDGAARNWCRIQPSDNVAHAQRQ